MKVVRSRIPSYAPLGNSEQHPIIIFDEVEDPLSSSPAVISVHRKRGFQDLCTNNHLAHGRVQRQLKISEFSHHVADFFKLRKEALTACQHLDELRTLLLGISSSTTSLALSGLEQSLVTARSAASLLTVRFPAYTTLVEALLAFFADDDKACAARNRSPFSCTWDTRPESLRPRQKRRFESPRGLLRESGSHPIFPFPFNSSTNQPFRLIESSTSVAISDSHVLLNITGDGSAELVSIPVVGPFTFTPALPTPSGSIRKPATSLAATSQSASTLVFTRSEPEDLTSLMFSANSNATPAMLSSNSSSKGRSGDSNLLPSMSHRLTKAKPVMKITVPTAATSGNSSPKHNQQEPAISLINGSQ